jgi:hypothetical protein
MTTDAVDAIDELSTDDKAIVRRTLKHDALARARVG